MALRLVVYDASLRASPDAAQNALGCAWWAGARLYRAMRRVDAHFGATSWSEALQWLATRSPGESIAEIQYWGHGRWGRVLIGDDVFDESAFERHSAHRLAIEALRRRFLPGGRSLVWLRTCEAFGAHVGQRFAVRLANELGASVAGHTHIIGALQSGLHGLRPGARPAWSPAEGLAEGTPEAPRRALWSSLAAPNTIHFMSGEVPPRWFDG